jgi:CAAX prenyl protease-like protein
LLIRVVGYVVTVPLVEELAFRGYLTRRVIQADFQKLPVGIFSWSSFFISSALFGALHGGLWLAGTIAGMSFALALYRRRSFGDAVQAHATTNGLIALYVFATGRWSVWS